MLTTLSKRVPIQYINPEFGGPWDMLWKNFLIAIFIMLQKNTFGQNFFSNFMHQLKVPFRQLFNFSKKFCCFRFLLVLTASTCSLEYSLTSISFLTLFDTRVYSSSICLYLQYSSESSIKFLILDSLETRLGITRVFKKKS